MQAQQERIENLVSKYQREKRFALAAMQDMQHEFTHVPREGLVFLADYLSCSLADLYAMATFYKSLSLVPRGKHIIKLCDGTACHIRGSMNILDSVTGVLGIKPGETSQDNLFTLETVNCLGVCAIAPVILIDNVYYGKLTASQLPDIFESYSKMETEK